MHGQTIVTVVALPSRSLLVLHATTQQHTCICNYVDTVLSNLYVAFNYCNF